MEKSKQNKFKNSSKLSTFRYGLKYNRREKKPKTFTKFIMIQKSFPKKTGKNFTILKGEKSKYNFKINTQMLQI